MRKLKFTLPNKFTGRQLDQFIDDFYVKYNKHGRTVEYEFDLSDVEWMSNQEMLVMTAIFKSMIDSGENIKIIFLKNGSARSIDRRVANQIFQLWSVWRIYQVAPSGKFQKYFDIDGKTVEHLQKQFGINFNNIEIYDRYGITPFVTLNKISNYDDRIIGEMLHDTYKLSAAVNDILKINNCSMPFENHTLSSIITKELYENFLDHVSDSRFGSMSNSAFMSLSLAPKMRMSDEWRIQNVLSKNYSEEAFPEFKNFYHDSKNGKFYNRALLQFSFLDFGAGITSTLKDEFFKQHPAIKESLKSEEVDSKILRWAFKYDSSQDPIEKRYLSRTVIPRGLYDIISIVRRFGGLITARSNYGKVAFDFSDASDKALDGETFGDELKLFPGTLITIVIPERRIDEPFDSSKIAIPTIKAYDSNKQNIVSNYIDLYGLIKTLESSSDNKGELYSKLFDAIVKETAPVAGKTKINYLDFSDFEIDENITKKIIHFMVSDYSVNASNNIIVLNPPPKEFLITLNTEILQLNRHVKSYRLHPIPFINRTEGGIDIFWMGVYNQQDVKALSNLLLDQHDLRRTDFKDPDAVSGNINFYDSFGNMHSYIDAESIGGFFDSKKAASAAKAALNIVSKYIVRQEGRLFLCPGNYYQEEYLQLYDAINQKDECRRLAIAMFNMIQENIKMSKDLTLLCVTESARQLIKEFPFDPENNPKLVYLDNYHSIINDTYIEGAVYNGDKVVIICDLFSTGYLTRILCTNLERIGAKVEKIAVLIDAYDQSFDTQNENTVIREKIISVLKYKMKKYRRQDIANRLINKDIEIIRINPYTNTPILESSEISSSKDRILLSNSEFMAVVGEAYIKAGYFKFNNLIHPYFFDMNALLSDPDVSRNLLTLLFRKLGKSTTNSIQMVFYPKGSAIQKINFDEILSSVFRDHSVIISELERFNTNEGWRFPHPAKFLRDLARDRIALIIDDGSCSGDSLMQMIDEVATLGAKEIIVVSIIGRLNDHKKDFFARLSTVKGEFGSIPLTVYFGVQWHIPTYYIEESPIIRERIWLESLIKTPNLPRKIRTTAENVLGELSLKNINEKGSRYLLRRRDGESIIRDLLLVKEEVGKVTSYRYYTDYFKFFDTFIEQYEGVSTISDRYKLIESICAVFLHEPSLYNRVRTILPDLTEKIEIFIQTILFGNPERPGKIRLSKERLYYKWANKNLIHLLFIVYRNEYFFKLISNDKLKILISDFVTSESDLYYLFYRLLKYFPLSEPEVSRKPFAGRAKYLIEVLKENPQLDEKTKRHVKRFSTFISSLPTNQQSFFESLAVMKNAYGRINDDAYHNEYIYNDKQIVVSQLRLLPSLIINKEPISETVAVVQRYWSKISEFISKLLNFYSSYPTFFFSHDLIYNSANGKKSLAQLAGIIDEAVHSEDFSNVEQLIAIINEIFSEFILDGSYLHAIFTNISVQNIGWEFRSFLEEVVTAYPNLKLQEKESEPTLAINFPLIYLKDVVFKEIMSNLRYADESSPVIFSWQTTSTYVRLTVANKVKLGSVVGGGTGLSKLLQLNQFPEEIKFSAEEHFGSFIQVIQLPIA